MNTQFVTVMINDIIYEGYIYLVEGETLDHFFRRDVQFLPIDINDELTHVNKDKISYMVEH